MFGDVNSPVRVFPFGQQLFFMPEMMRRFHQHQIEQALDLRGSRGRGLTQGIDSRCA